MDVVDKILKLLQETNTEQKQLTAYLGVGPQTVSDWKSGKTKSYMKHLDRIAEYFNVSTDYLLGKESAFQSTDDELKFALFNGTEGITDEMFNEVKQFAAMVKMRENAKRKENK